MPHLGSTGRGEGHSAGFGWFAESDPGAATIFRNELYACGFQSPTQGVNRHSVRDNRAGQRLNSFDGCERYFGRPSQCLLIPFE